MQWIKAKERLPNNNDIYFCKENTGAVTYYHVAIFDGNIFVDIEKHDSGVKTLNSECTEWLDESRSESDIEAETLKWVMSLNCHPEYIKEAVQERIDEVKKK